MPYQQDTAYSLHEQVHENCRYIIASQHRIIGNSNKSTWYLSHEGEIECFVFSYCSKWIDGHVCWGLVYKDSDVQILGHNFHNEELKIAKFVDANKNRLWHGYPADYLRKAHDRPTITTLKDWVSKGYITKSKMSKIRLGQLCNL